MSGPAQPERRALARRAGLLAACVLAGSLVGVAVQHLYGTSAGFLAVPLFILVAWLFVADPTRCTPHAKDGPDAEPPAR